MQDHELDAWLGDTRAELTDDQYDTIRHAAVDIQARYPGGADDADEVDAALSAAMQWVLGEITVPEVAGTLLRARQAARRASVAAQQIAVMEIGAGGTEAGVARAVGLDRLTVRRALGK